MVRSKLLLEDWWAGSCKPDSWAWGIWSIQTLPLTSQKPYSPVISAPIWSVDTRLFHGASLSSHPWIRGPREPRGSLTNAMKWGDTSPTPSPSFLWQPPSNEVIRLLAWQRWVLNRQGWGLALKSRTFSGPQNIWTLFLLLYIFSEFKMEALDFLPMWVS